MQSDKNYQVVKSARIFAIGGIGYAGVITDEETAFNALCKAPDAAEQFRRLLAGSPLLRDRCICFGRPRKMAN